MSPEKGVAVVEVASILSLALFVAFVTAGAQKVIFNPSMSHAAERLGFSKSAYQRIGVAEIVAGVVLIAGLSATGSSLLAILNEVAAAGLVLLMIGAVRSHRRAGEAWRSALPALALGAAALLEVVFRLVG